MRCTTCDYRLWNIRSRKCPECGTEFLPSKHEFVPNSVQFCCPHCNTAYYGTGEKGHLVPPEFDCVSCQTHIHMDDMVLLPTKGLKEEQTNVDQIPWLNRTEIGSIKAWFRTVGMAMAHPARLIKLVPEQSPALSAIEFGVLSNTIVSLAGIGVLFAIPVLIGITAAGGGRPAFGIAAGLCIALFVTIVASIATVLLWGVSVHGLLRLTGRSTAGLGRTFHAIGYSAGANALSAIPVCGLYVGWIWWAVSATVMVKEAHRASGVRAAFAVLTLPLLGVCSAMAMWGFLIYAGITAGQAGRIPGTWTNATPLTGSLHDYAARNSNRLPDHPVQLITAGSAIGGDFVVNGSILRQKKLIVGDLSIDQFNYPPKPLQLASVDAAIKALPPNVIASRLGDFIFTYYGIDLTTPAPGLWLVVEVPEQLPSGTTTFSVGYADGSTTQFPIAFLSRVPNKQNALRAKYNLPPLPLLTTVTQGHPAVHTPDGTE